MISRGELKGRILRVLNKTPKNQGFYTDEKIHDAIQEAIDDIATEMFIADEGWLTKIASLDTQDNTVSVRIPPYMNLIKEVRYLWEDIYERLDYDDASEQSQYAPGAGATQFPSRYRVVDNMFYFNPALATGGAGYLQVEYMSYPRVLSDDNDTLDPQFDNAMQHYIKYQAATILQRSFGKYNVEWEPERARWQQKVQTIITRRNLQTTPIREFSGL